MNGKLQTHRGDQKGIKEHEAPGIGTDLNGTLEENGSRKADGTILTIETEKMLEAVREATLVRVERTSNYWPSPTPAPLVQCRSSA